MADGSRCGMKLAAQPAINATRKQPTKTRLTMPRTNRQLSRSWSGFLITGRTVWRRTLIVSRAHHLAARKSKSSLQRGVCGVCMIDLMLFSLNDVLCASLNDRLLWDRYTRQIGPRRIFRAFMNLAADILAELVVIEDYVSGLRIQASLFFVVFKEHQGKTGSVWF